jgi:hypothetical protein
MATPTKVTSGNHKPGNGDGRFRVYSKQFNALVDTLTDGTASIVTGDLTVEGTATFNGTLVLGDAAADALTVNATTTYGAPVNYSNATTITAFATGGQASATALTEEINNVTTVATAGDSVKLPAAVAGAHIYVKNSGATALDIFPASADSIDALAINLAVRIQPGSSINFYAKDATVWESSIDNSITLNSPTTVTGQLEIKAAASAGNTVTTITNASQAAARTYTVPDAGASANFVMSEGAATVNGIKTFGSGIVLPVGAVGTPSVQIGATDTGFYHVSGSQTGFTQDGSLVATFDPDGLTANTVRLRSQLGTGGAGTVAVVEYGDGRDVTTELTLTNFIVGDMGAAAAAKAFGNLIYTFPAGAHITDIIYMSLGFTGAGTANTPDVGIGSVVGVGAVATLDLVAPEAEDYIAGQTANDITGTPEVFMQSPTTNIKINMAAEVKEVYLNAASTWAADNSGNLTATGLVTIKWTLMS